jgi:hypothetical protein
MKSSGNRRSLHQAELGSLLEFSVRAVKGDKGKEIEFEKWKKRKESW